MNTSAKLFSWQCYACKHFAKDGFKLELDFGDGGTTALYDIDRSVWVRCNNCKTSFHLNCITKLKNASDINKEGTFTCCH